MNIRFLLFAATAIVTGIASAQESIDYDCSYGDIERRVVVVHEPGVRVPCEVRYYRDMSAPGEYDVLWQALYETGYCEARAEELTARLVEVGWQCDPSERPAPKPEKKIEEQFEETTEEAVDDTDVLEPPEPAEPVEPPVVDDPDE